MQGFLIQINHHPKEDSMICPSCGIDNADDSPQCSNCGYKFRFGYAFDDPKRVTFINWSGKHKMARTIFIGIIIIIFAWSIFLWIKSL
ncbi:MAG: zinc-ribbon domain-containing protein [Calditrichaeota bacterium]|nr:MAG: zinc-ribbon domain-containing protein [Calditrichota bacterium]